MHSCRPRCLPAVAAFLLLIGLTGEGEQGGTSETIWRKQQDGSCKVTGLTVT